MIVDLSLCGCQNLSPVYFFLLFPVLLCFVRWYCEIATTTTARWCKFEGFPNWLKWMRSCTKHARFWSHEDMRWTVEFIRNCWLCKTRVLSSSFVFNVVMDDAPEGALGGCKDQTGNWKLPPLLRKWLYVSVRIWQTSQATVQVILEIETIVNSFPH